MVALIVLLVVASVGAVGSYGFVVGLTYRLLKRHGGHEVAGGEDILAAVWPLTLVAFLIWAVTQYPARLGGRMVDAIEARRTRRPSTVPEARVVQR